MGVDLLFHHSKVKDTKTKATTAHTTAEIKTLGCRSFTAAKPQMTADNNAIKPTSALCCFDQIGAATATSGRDISWLDRCCSISHFFPISSFKVRFSAGKSDFGTSIIWGLPSGGWPASGLSFGGTRE